MTQGLTSGEALSVHHLSSDHLADQDVSSETVSYTRKHIDGDHWFHSYFIVT